MILEIYISTVRFLNKEAYFVQVKFTINKELKQMICLARIIIFILFLFRSHDNNRG